MTYRPPLAGEYSHAPSTPTAAPESDEGLVKALEDIRRARTKYGATGFPMGLYPDPASWMEARAEQALDDFFKSRTGGGAEPDAARAAAEAMRVKCWAIADERAQALEGYVAGESARIIADKIEALSDPAAQNEEGE